jgi:hypothetical protein
VRANDRTAGLEAARTLKAGMPLVAEVNMVRTIEAPG